MELLPRFALKEGVVAIGEIGYDEQTALEDKYFRAAARAGEGARPAGDDPHPAPRQEARHHALDGRRRWSTASIRRSVVIDHNNEETVAEVLERGFWAAFSIYPHTKMGNERMVRDRAAVRRRADHRRLGLRLGHLRSARRCRRPRSSRCERGIPEDDVRKLACYANALDAYGQSGQMREADWLKPPADRPAHPL